MVYYTTTAGGALRARIGGGFKLVYDSSTAVVDTGFGTPLFSASFENGDTVPTWADQELSFGESFVKGEVPAGSRVRAVVNGAVIPCQASNRRVWPDGSLRVADFKVQVPSVAVGAMLEVVWERVDGSWTAHDTPLHTSTAAITSKVALEYAFTSWKGRSAANALTEERGPKVFRSTDMLGAGNSPWIDNVVAGPVCCEWRASDMALLPGGGKDSNFGAILYAQAWGGTAGNPKRIRFVYRTMQGWSTDTPADEQGIRVDANLNVNGTTVRGAAIGTSGWSSINTWKGGFLMSAGTEGEMDWYDVATASWVTPPKLVYRRNIEHGVASKFIPPIDTSNPSMPMTAAAMTYVPAKRGPLRPIQDDVADANMISWTTSKPVAWVIGAHARATATQLANHQRYCRSAAFGMGAMTSVGFHRTTRKIVNYLPPAKQTNEGTLGASIYGSGKPADANQTFRYNAGVPISAGTFTRVGTGTMSSDSTANTVSITYVDSSTTLRGTHPVVIGQSYRVMFTVSGSDGAQYSAGNAAGGTQYKSLTTATAGINSFDFTASSTTTLHISFTRPSAGANTFSILTIAQVEVANLDAAHFPQMSWWPAYEHGEQHLIDLAYHEATLPGLFEATNYGFYGSSTINGVTVPFGGISYRGQIRAASHNARALGNALAIGNPADPHWVMARDYVNHWAEMIERVAQEEDLWRVGSGQPSGLTRTDGRRFQDLKALVPNNEPTYKIWMHTLGLGAMAHSYGMTEFPRLKELAERFAYLPTVMAGGYTNDNDYLMKPDPVEAVGYEVICMDGLTANGEFRRYWRPGQWSGALTDCTYKADGQTIQFNTPAFGSTTMLNGMVMTASYLRGVGEPHWADTTKPQPAGLTLGIPYYSVQSSGLTCKLSLSLGGPPVTFTPVGGVDQVGHIFRRPVGGVHPMKAGTETSVDANSYLVQVASALDMVAHYCSPDDIRVGLARANLRRLLSTRSSPNAFDERGKTTVPTVIQIVGTNVSGTAGAKKPAIASTATMEVEGLAIPVSAFTTVAGDGTTSVDTASGSMTIAFGTTATSLRGSASGLTVGRRYRVSWTMSSTNATQGQAGFGTSLGGPQYRPTMGGVSGVNTYDFDAVQSILYATFQRASAGSSTFSQLSLVQIPQVAWTALAPQPITPSFWTALSAGVTVNSTSGDITIPATGTLLSAAGSFATTVGKTYRLAWTTGGNTVQALVGTAQGGTSLKSSGVNHAVGSATYEFVATGTTTWVQFQRTTTGTATVSGVVMQEIFQAPSQSGPWTQVGSGFLNNGSDTSITITGNSEEIGAQRTIVVDPFTRYTLTFSSDVPVNYTIEEV